MVAIEDQSPADEYRERMAPISDVMTVPEAARFLRVSQGFMLRELDAGTIPGWRVGKRWRVSRRALEVRLAADRPRTTPHVSAAVLSGKE